MSVKIIAEAGVNHNGSIKKALQLIKKAKLSGADYIKFQIFNTRNVVSKSARKSKYQKTSSEDKTSQFDMIKKLELPYDAFYKIKKQCLKYKIKFLCSAFDIDSLIFLKKLNEKVVKIPSGEITNYPLLKMIGKLKFKAILSTGMSSLREINSAIKILKSNGLKKKNIVLMHCNTAYPTPMRDVNLLSILKLKKKFKLDVGLSDHSQGIEIPIAAIAVGACIVEKHFTLDKNLEGPDHKSSLNPSEFSKMVKSIRNIEQALTTKKGSITISEKENLSVVRKSIVTKKKIKAGEVFSEKNLTTKRPGTGLSPMKWNEVMGKKAKKDYLEEEIIYKI